MPKIKNPKDTGNFDSDFTREKPGLTPIPAEQLAGVDQSAFTDFSFVNPAYSDDALV